MRNRLKIKRMDQAWCRAASVGTTLVELVVAVAIMAVVVGTVLPLFASMRRTWDTSQNTAEALQNGRVVMDHLHRNLSEATRITAVSNASQTSGYIQFEDNTDTTLRYEIGTGNYVDYGEVGSLARLAGPVSQLQFTCYEASDFSTPITDVNSIRYVKVQSTLVNAAENGQDLPFTTSAYLRTNGLGASGSDEFTKGTSYEFDTAKGKTPALAQIDGTHYLCAYEGGPGHKSDDGWATVLTVGSTWDISKGTALEFDSDKGKTPALAQIDSTHYLCAYEGGPGHKSDDGWATILTVDTDTWTLTNGTAFEFDTTKGKTPALARIDSTHYLCAYAGDGDDGWAVVLTLGGSLAGHWKLDETLGTSAADSSDYGNHGTLTNMAGNEWTNGPVEGALEFDGNNDHIVGIGNCPTGDFTVLGWAMDTGGSGWKVVYSAEQEIWLGVDSGASPAVWLDCGSDSKGANTSAGTWDRNTWHHIAATWDGSDIHIYIDGVGMPITTYGSPENPTATAAVIGAYSSSPTYENWHGSLDDVRVHNRALNATEIAALANPLRYRGLAETKAPADTTSVALSIPAGTSTGDLLVTAVATDGDTDTSLAAPGGQGWTEINVNSSSSEVTLGAWWKLAESSESSTHTFIWSGAEQAYAWMMRFSGHDPSDPIDVFAADYSTSSSPTSPAVTTTVEDAIVLRLGAFDDVDITEGSPGLSGHTAITMDASGGAGQVNYEGFAEAKRSSPGNSLSINIPSGTSTGNLLIASVVINNDKEYQLSPPAGGGWTEIDLDDTSDRVTLGVWWKLAGASEASSHQWTWSGESEEAYGWIMRFTGHHASSPIHAWGAYGNDSRSPDCPSVTTTQANCMILRIGGFNDDEISEDSPGLSGHTAITMDESSSGSGTCSGGAGYQQQSSTGSSGIAEFALGDREYYRTVTVAIAPALGSSGSVSGGAGYVTQAGSGSSGTSTFALTDAQEARMVTIGVAPAFQSESESGPWTLSKGNAHEFDSVKGKTPALSKIDDTHYLCAYAGDGDDGWAVVLTVDTNNWTLSKGTSYEFDSTKGKTPALAQIDSTHYLCAYEGDGDDGWATVLTVNTGSWTISKGTAHEFDSVKGKTPALSKIDDTHYLCAYAGDGDDGWAVVLTVDTNNWTLSQGTSFEFDTAKGKTPALQKILNSHHLCAYEGDGDDGWAVVLIPEIEEVLP